MKRVDGLVQLKKWQVLHAKAYKSRATAARHEYISAAVVDTHDPNRKITFIAIERGRGDTTNTNTETQNGSFSSFKLNPSSSSVSDSISPTRLANDKISPMSSEMRKKDDELIYSLDFKNSKPLFLYELAILALVVHEENTSYMLMKNNCYHFAGIIMRVLKEGYDTVNVVEYAGGARKWCGIVIYDGEGYYNLLEKFKTNIKDFVSFVPILLNFTYASWGIGVSANESRSAV